MYRSGGRNRKNPYTKDSRNSKENKDSRNPKKNKNPRNAKENKDSRNPKEDRNPRNTKNKDSRSYHNPHIHPEKRLSWRAEAGYPHMPLLLSYCNILNFSSLQINFNILCS